MWEITSKNSHMDARYFTELRPMISELIYDHPKRDILIGKMIDNFGNERIKLPVLGNRDTTYILKLLYLYTNESGCFIQYFIDMICEDILSKFYRGGDGEFHYDLDGEHIISYSE